MEGQCGYENLMQLMSLTSGGNANDVSIASEGYPKQQFIIAAGKNGNHPVTRPLPQRIHSQQTSHNHVKFLAESSTFLHRVPTRDIQEGIRAVNAVSESEREIVYNNSGKESAFKVSDSLDMDAWKVKPSVYMLNSNNREASIKMAGVSLSDQNEILYVERCNIPKVRYLRPHNEGEPGNKFSSTEYQILAQNHTSWTQESNEDNCNVSQPHSRVTVAIPGFLSKPPNNVARQRATVTDRRRRLRISERLKALQELLPCSGKNGKASILDGIVDHIKYLQLQIKDLSRSRLGGESTSDPFVFLEGYGHYILHEQMLNEPLEEMMGKLLEENPLAATQLLGSRGLSMMSMALAEGLLQAI